MKLPCLETRNDQFYDPLLSYPVRAFRLFDCQFISSDRFIYQLSTTHYCPLVVPLRAWPGSSENGGTDHQSLPPALHLVRSSPTDQA